MKKQNKKLAGCHNCTGGETKTPGIWRQSSKLTSLTHDFQTIIFCDCLAGQKAFEKENIKRLAKGLSKIEDPLTINDFRYAVKKIKEVDMYE